ncbi:pYEATS domain-containing protein [Nitrosomonas sp. Is35]|uniref:pYEATS domain-containing protein n=1 Tax=Nitrosomonas sp. Is35 TaxID=3080534 RepID=UPI00294AE680|nr:pYEATS domain-containing protein [Nitrosomonas sp. Is35]MDV6347095.1 pYEATS domain-containing protein [Nitrosomonas sp. Is35]
MTTSEVISLVQAIIWPTFALIVVFVFRRSLIKLLSAVEKRIDSGAEVTSTWVTFGAVPSNLKSPEGNAPVTDSHLALIHSSWRYPKKDAEYKRPMYTFHVVIQATDEVLDRIESVKYSLHPSYPNPIQIVTDRKSRFKLKELAWGESSVRAEIKIKEQEQTIKLSRYINLTQSGPRI